MMNADHSILTTDLPNTTYNGPGFVSSSTSSPTTTTTIIITSTSYRLLVVVVCVVVGGGGGVTNREDNEQGYWCSYYTIQVVFFLFSFVIPLLFLTSLIILFVCIIHFYLPTYLPSASSPAL